MKIWFSIVNLIALFCILWMTDAIYQEVGICERQYNEQRMIKSVEYASEKAFYDSVGTKSTGLDYNDPVSVIIDPEKTKESFNLMMEMNYGLSISGYSDTAVEDSIAAMALMATDGFYLAKLQRTAEYEWRLFWTPKYPYVFWKQEGDTAYTYAVTLSDERWTKVWRRADNSLGYESGNSYFDPELGGEITDDIRRKAVSQTLTDAIAQSMEDNALFREEIRHALYFPSKQTLSGINSIHAPSFLVVMHEAPYAGIDHTLDAAITGLKVIRRIRAVGYWKNGRRMYCMETQGAVEDIYGGVFLPGSEIADDNVQNTYGIRYFTTAEDAARAGYLPDYDYIFNKIDTTLLLKRDY